MVREPAEIERANLGQNIHLWIDAAFHDLKYRNFAG